MTRAAAGAVVGLTVIAPVYLLLRILGDVPTVREVFSEPRTWSFFANSLALAVFVSISSAIIGTAAAWWITRLAMHRALRVAAIVLWCVPLVIPSYVAAFGILVAAGERGVLGGLLPPGLLRDYPLVTAWIVLTSCTYPYTFLAARSAILRQCGSLEEAAIGLGASRLRTFFRITLPGIAPASLWGGTLAGLYTLADFGAVSMIGYETLTWAIYHRHIEPGDRDEALVLAVILAAAALVLLAVMVLFRPRSDSTGAVLMPQSPLRWNGWLIALAAVTAVPLCIGALLPMTTIVQFTVAGAAGFSPVEFFRTTFETLGRTVTGTPVQTAADSVYAQAGQTLVFAAIAAVVVIALCFPLVAMSFGPPEGRDRKLARRLAPVTLVSFAIPGLVIAIAAYAMALGFDDLVEQVISGEQSGRILYQSFTLLLLAYAAMFLPEAIGPIQSAGEQIHRDQIDAARQLDGRRGRLWRRIIIPQLAPGLAAGAALVFVTTARELPATLLLAPPGVRTLATGIWENEREGFYDHAATSSLALIVLCAIGLVIVFMLERRGHATVS